MEADGVNKLPFNNGVAGEEKHVLSIAEMPSHTHNLYYETNGTGVSVPTLNPTVTGQNLQATLATGGNQAHNNIPPTFTIVIWRRLPDPPASI